MTTAEADLCFPGCCARGRVPVLALALLLAAAVPVPLPAAPAAARHPQAIGTPGQAVLRKCRDWMVFEHCKSYSHIDIPRTLAVGDTLPLTFSSNNKSFDFRVVDIIRRGTVCHVTSVANPRGETDLAVDSLIVDDCTVASNGDGPEPPLAPGLDPGAANR